MDDTHTPNIIFYDYRWHEIGTPTRSHFFFLPVMRVDGETRSFDGLSISTVGVYIMRVIVIILLRCPYRCFELYFFFFSNSVRYHMRTLYSLLYKHLTLTRLQWRHIFTIVFVSIIRLAIDVRTICHTVQKTTMCYSFINKKNKKRIDRDKIQTL